MKYKVGDKVRVKSLDWYNTNKDEYGDIPLIMMSDSKYNFIDYMSGFCGKIVTINNVCENKGYYDITEDDSCWYWTDEMFEGLVVQTPITENKMVDLNTVLTVLKRNISKYTITKTHGCYGERFWTEIVMTDKGIEQFCKDIEQLNILEE